MSTGPIYGGPPGPAPAPMGAPAPQKPQKSNNKMLGVLLVAAVLLFGCVPCTGILASVAIPAFVTYVKRSKTSEAESNLRALYAGAASYYNQERVGPDGTAVSGCTVGPAITGNVPGPTMQVLGTLGPPFDDLGFALYDPVLYRYEIVADPAACGHGPNQSLYTFRAHGDLDGDGITSLFELSVGTDAAGEIYRTPDLYIERELE